MTTGNTPSDTARRPDWAALAVAVLLAALGGLILWDSSRLGSVAGYSPVGPASVPIVVALGLIGLALWTVFAALRGDFPERERQEFGPVFWIVAGLALQMLLLKTAGFSIATGMLFAATAGAFGRRKLWLTLPIGILFSLAVWLVFAGLLQLSLPAGPLERLFF